MGVHIRDNGNRISENIKTFFIDNGLDLIKNESDFNVIKKHIVITILDLSHLNGWKDANKYANELLDYGISYIYVICIIKKENEDLIDYLRQYEIPGHRTWWGICLITEDALGELFDVRCYDEDRREIVERVKSIEITVEEKDDIKIKNKIRELHFEALHESLTNNMDILMEEM